jgi:hypothetical protein
MHLLDTLQKLCNVAKDCGGTLCRGLTLDWNCAKKHVDVSMPNCIPSFMLHHFQHPTPKNHQGAPHPWTTTACGAKVQHATKPDDSPTLSAAKIIKIQQQVGTSLCCAVINVDPFMLTAPGTIASSQSQATQLTKDECLWLMLDCAASNPLSIIQHHASGMFLHVHSNASCSSESRARSRISGTFSSAHHHHSTQPSLPPMFLHSMAPFRQCAKSSMLWLDPQWKPKLQPDV